MREGLGEGFGGRMDDVLEEGEEEEGEGEGEGEGQVDLVLCVRGAKAS